MFRAHTIPSIYDGVFVMIDRDSVYRECLGRDRDRFIHLGAGVTDLLLSSFLRTPSPCVSEWTMLRSLANPQRSSSASSSLTRSHHLPLPAGTNRRSAHQYGTAGGLLSSSTPTWVLMVPLCFFLVGIIVCIRYVFRSPEIEPVLPGTTILGQVSYFFIPILFFL
jgi:hypothetical protein